MRRWSNPSIIGKLIAPGSGGLIARHRPLQRFVRAVPCTRNTTFPFLLEWSEQRAGTNTAMKGATFVCEVVLPDCKGEAGTLWHTEDTSPFRGATVLPAEPDTSVRPRARAHAGPPHKAC
eukprot:gene12925-biopygen11030